MRCHGPYRIIGKKIMYFFFFLSLGTQPKIEKNDVFFLYLIVDIWNVLDWNSRHQERNFKNNIRYHYNIKDVIKKIIYLYYYILQYIHNLQVLKKTM